VDSKGSEVIVEALTNSGLLVLGIVIVIVSIAVMAIHPYQRSRVGLRHVGSAGGPVWFVLMVIGFGVIGLAIYLPS
jgi:hypothetical protein